MRNDHFLRQTRDDRAFIEQRIRNAEQRHAKRKMDMLGWLILIACGIVLGCGTVALFIP